MSNLNGKTALVTGATKRIGREIALALADPGRHLMEQSHGPDHNY